MSSVWKQSIKNFLIDKSEKSLRTQLRSEWISLYPEEKSEIYNFLFQSGLHKVFIYLFAVDLRSQIVDLPWSKTFLIIKTQKVELPKDFFKEIYLAFRQQRFLNKKVSKLGELIVALQEEDVSHFSKTVRKKKQELLASARIAESEQLHEQQVHYMGELKKMFPNEYNVASLISDREKQRAEKIIAKISKRRQIQRTHSSFHFSDEDQKLIEHLNEQAQNLLNSKNVTATDLAYLFRSFGDNTKAIDFIYQNKDEEKRDWQLLDYLFNGKQYLSLLDHCQHLKNKYSQFPDALFSISYAEAVAYWELGEKQKAVDLMGQIASMRPDFKSASETLAQWREDHFE